MFTVGEIRNLIADLPADMPVGPVWSCPPGDADPAVSIDGFVVRVDPADATKRVLGVLVSLVPLEGDDEDDDEEAETANE